MVILRSFFKKEYHKYGIKIEARVTSRHSTLPHSLPLIPGVWVATSLERQRKYTSILLQYLGNKFSK